MPLTARMRSPARSPAWNASPSKSTLRTNCPLCVRRTNRWGLIDDRPLILWCESANPKRVQKKSKMEIL
jgi:hypothetical protein